MTINRSSKDSSHFVMNEFHGNWPNPALEPTTCPIANSCAAFSLAQISARSCCGSTHSYGLKPYRNFNADDPIVMTKAGLCFSNQPSCKEAISSASLCAVIKQSWPALFSSTALSFEGFGTAAVNGK